ncbi:MAG: sulfite exporter TauE/SafE family protein [Candidatus Hodarchaeota archaeon]
MINDISNFIGIEFLFLSCIAFFCEYIDSSLGAGYGTTLTPLLMLFGFDPSLIVPAVLFSEFLSGILSGILHVLVKNMQVGTNKQALQMDSRSNIKLIGNSKTSSLNLDQSRIARTYLNMTIDSKIIVIFSFFGVAGSIIAACISSVFNYSAMVKFGIKMYIGIMVLSMGIITLGSGKMNAKFSFKKITVIGALAGFNKSISGGGYGPLAVTGQVIIGRDGKNAIGTTSLSEGIICLSGVITYFITSSILGTSFLNFKLALPLVIGALSSTPLAVVTTKKIKNSLLKKLVGFSSILLGILSVLRLFMP